jgi:peptidoglycan DL-endopeptidase CwlO
VTAAVAVPDGVVAVRSRIAALESQLGIRRPSSSASAFALALGGATAEIGAAPVVQAMGAVAGGSGAKAVETAKTQLGVPYVWGAEDPSTGFDCSGLVQWVYKQQGIDLPRVSRDQARTGQPVASLAEARPGDLVAFGTPVDHIGIYAGDNKMVVAPHRGAVVRIQEITTTPTAIRRVASDAPAGRAPTSFDQLFAAAGARHGVDPRLLASVAKAESGLRPDAVSPAGARGLMQLMPATAASLGVDAFDPAQAVDGAARLLRSHLDRYGSTELALAAYNAGPGAVNRYGGIPPYRETQTYVRRVVAGMSGGM